MLTPQKKIPRQILSLLENKIIYYIEVYNKNYDHSLSEATKNAASLIKSSTTLSNTSSTLHRRNSSETQLGEALEHDDWKNTK
jgi:hypothetical protein